MDIRIEKVAASRDKLGEGALLDSRMQRLFWVDAVQCRVRSLDPASGTVRDWQLPSHVGSLAPMASPDREPLPR